jgi:ribosome modulation factor
MSALEKGKADFDAGVKRWMNPYSRGQPQFVAWLRGWRQAEIEELKLKYKA